MKSDRYPHLGEQATFSPAVPILKALLPNKPSYSVPHSLTYIECGYTDPVFPLDRCKVLLPNLSSWQAHQFLSHQLGFLCMKCHNWLETEAALSAHISECEQPGVGKGGQVAKDEDKKVWVGLRQSWTR